MVWTSGTCSVSCFVHQSKNHPWASAATGPYIPVGNRCSAGVASSNIEIYPCGLGRWSREEYPLLLRIGHDYLHTMLRYWLVVVDWSRTAQQCTPDNHCSGHEKWIPPAPPSLLPVWWSWALKRQVGHLASQCFKRCQSIIRLTLNFHPCSQRLETTCLYTSLLSYCTSSSSPRPPPDFIPLPS